VKLVERVSAKAQSGSQPAKDALRDAAVRVTQHDVAGAVTILASVLGTAPTRKSFRAWVDSVAGFDFTLPGQQDDGVSAWADSALQKATAYGEAVVAASARNSLYYKLYQVFTRSGGAAGTITDADIDLAVTHAADDVLLYGSSNFVDELRKFVNDKGYQGLKDLIRSRVPEVISQIQVDIQREKIGEAETTPNGL